MMESERPPYTVTLSDIQSRFNRIVSHLQETEVPSHIWQDLYDDLERYDPEDHLFAEVNEHPMDPQLLQYLFVGYMVTQNFMNPQ